MKIAALSHPLMKCDKLKPQRDENRWEVARYKKKPPLYRSDELHMRVFASEMLTMTPLLPPAPPPLTPQNNRFPLLML